MIIYFCRELIENSNAPKHQKISQTDHTQLVDLLISKDNEMKSVLKLAEEQAQIEQRMNALKQKVHLRDQQIKRLQRRLKDSEEILSRALFQARQKLASIAVANKKTVPSEELIKYAYRFVIFRSAFVRKKMIRNNLTMRFLCFCFLSIGLVRQMR